MPGSFYGISLASRALRAFQSALDVTGHNVANASTTGYTRQIADLSGAYGVRVNGLQSFILGGGVDVASVNRSRDVFLAMRMQSTQSEISRSDAMLSTLKQIEGVMNEPGANGIGSALDKFFDSWSALAANPGEASLKMQVQTAASTLASRIRSVYREVSGQASQANEQVTTTFDRIDQLTSSIANLNSQIRQGSANGAKPNDLMDQRDQMVNELSSLMNVQTSENSDGTVQVMLSGYALVDYSGSRPIPRTFDANAQTVTDPATNLSLPVTGGRLAGQFQAIVRAGSMQSDLDKLATTIRDQVNALHVTGTNQYGTTDLDFFGGTGAGDFDLSNFIKNDAGAIATGTSGRPGDGGLALALAGLRDTKVAGLGNLSMKQFYGGVVSGIGNDIATQQTNLETHQAVAEQITGQIEAVSGVNLDDEMANMLRFQRSYQAAAKTLSIFDQVTEDLIGLIR
ncbi:MAG: flagellar hook-associated protein FlgK [Fimbriimonadales bacterium]